MSLNHDGPPDDDVRRPHLRPVTDPPYDPEYDGGAPGGPSGRTPPNDLAAEQSVLGAMILDPGTIPTVAELITGTDYYRPTHEALHDALVQLHRDEKPIDTVTLAAHLGATKAGRGTLLTYVGGAPYLLTLTQTVPTPGHASHYATIVRDHARLRIAATLGTRLTQLAHAGTTDTIDATLGEAVQALDDAAMRFGTITSSSLTGLKDLSWLHDGQPPPMPPPQYSTRTDGTSLFYKGKVNGVFGDPEHGKAEVLTAEIQTPTGPRLMGDLVVGDRILGRDGHAQTIEAVYDRGVREVWEVITSDGVTIECCDEHLWTVQDHNQRKRGTGWATLTTRQLAEAGTRLAHGRPRWHLPQADAAVYDPQPALPLPPYLLGALLGDGHLGRSVTICSADQDLVDRVADQLPAGVTVRHLDRYDYALSGPGGPNPLITALRELGLHQTRSHTKFIPVPYLTASIDDRLELLRGLMDTDGGVEGRTVIATYATTSPSLAADVARLVQSLGGTATTSWRTTSSQNGPGRPSARMTIRLPVGINPFWLDRKADPYTAHTTRTAPKRTIAAIRATGRHEPMRCIAVSNPDHLYLTNGHVPTHNTWLAQTAIVEALRNGETAAMIDVDHNGPDHTAARLLLLGARLEHLANPTLFRYYEPEDADELRAAVDDVVAHKPDVVVIDSLGEIFPMLGVATNDGDEMTTAMRQVCTRPAVAGACVITIDHLPKSHDARSTGFAIGTIAKKRMIRGSYIRAEARQKPVPGGIGRITLRIEKDTTGELRKSSGGGYAGTLVLDSTHDHALLWSIGREDPSVGDDGQIRPTVLMEKISRFIEDNDQCTFRDIKDSITSKDKWIRLAIHHLVAEGFVSVAQGARNSQRHHAIALYREAEDDNADPTL